MPREQSDYWRVTDSVIIRFTNIPTQKMFVPKAFDCPVPLEYLDIMRRPETDIEAKAESVIHDFWITEKDADRKL